MLDVIGIESTGDLFDTVPSQLRLRALDLPPGFTEIEAKGLLEALCDQIQSGAPRLSFLGAGAYDHFTPSVVEALISRGEFFTAYTPYQAEVSQGTLRAIFEFQTMVCELTQMEVANASMYDGASALAEAVLMAARINDGRRVLVPRSLHPFYRSVVETYIRGVDLEVVEIPWIEESGTLDVGQLKLALNDEIAAVVVQNPNFLGVLESLDTVGQIVGPSPAVYVCAVNPISLGVIQPPGAVGADIVVGEGQPLGLPLSFGGPYVGFLATRERYLRKMPGRICGETRDVERKRGFVLTLKTREQDIRRERATSNICTNQALCATAVTIYLAALGPEGLREVGLLNWRRSHQAADALTRLKGVSRRFSGTTFNEFVVETERKASDVLAALREREIVGGLDLGRLFPDLDHCILVCVTETKTVQDLETLVAIWGAVNG